MDGVTLDVLPVVARMVPVAACCGSVAPIKSRKAWMALSRSSSIGTTGPEDIRCQALIERALGMHSIKFLGRLLAQLHQFQGAHAKALVFDACENFPNQCSTHCIRFDNRQRVFDHRSPPFAASACTVAATS